MERLNSKGEKTAIAELQAALEGLGSTETAISRIRRQKLVHSALPVIRAALKNAAPEIRAEACLALEYLGHASTSADLIPSLADVDAMVSIRAADALCVLGVTLQTILPRLIEILEQEEPPLPCGEDRIEPPCMVLQMPQARYHAARILSYFGKQAAPARSGLLSALSSASAIVRSAAASALANIGEPSDVYLSPLRQALHDESLQSARERVWAAEALLELGEPLENVVPELAALATHPDWSAAATAIDVLETVSAQSAAAVESLRHAANCGRDDVAQRAKSAIRRITKI